MKLKLAKTFSFAHSKRILSDDLIKMSTVRRISTNLLRSTSQFSLSEIERVHTILKDKEQLLGKLKDQIEYKLSKSSGLLAHSSLSLSMADLSVFDGAPTSRVKKFFRGIKHFISKRLFFQKSTRAIKGSSQIQTCHETEKINVDKRLFDTYGYNYKVAFSPQPHQIPILPKYSLKSLLCMPLDKINPEYIEYHLLDEDLIEHLGIHPSALGDLHQREIDDIKFSRSLDREAFIRRHWIENQQ